MELKSRYQPGDKILLLSYSSENLPIAAMPNFFNYQTAPKKDLWSWCFENKIDFVVLDIITHKQYETDGPVPTGLKLEKIEFARGVYYLYSLSRTP